MFVGVPMTGMSCLYLRKKFVSEPPGVRSLLPVAFCNFSSCTEISIQPADCAQLPNVTRWQPGQVQEGQGRVKKSKSRWKVLSVQADQRTQRSVRERLPVARSCGRHR